VIGLGPVGAIAAQLLALEGLQVVAIEPALTPYDKPRAIGIDHESLRILQRLGVADDLAPYMGAYPPSEYRSSTGAVLRRIVPQPAPFPLSWAPYNTFIQPELERLLRRRLKETEGLDVRLGTRMTGLVQDESGVDLTVQDETGGHSRIRTRYVVGCDGAWSPVREAAGLRLEDLQFDEPWLVVDMRVSDPSGLPDAIVQYCDPARPATFVPGPCGLYRWEIMLMPGETPADMIEPDRAWSLLRRWISREQGEIWRAAAYRFHALVAERWSDRRIFIAGDAAHQTPPFMAQGLNQGIRDVGNLAWKLGQVIRHGAGDDLLASYTAERQPNARAVIGLTKTFGQLICERDPAKAAERDRRMLDEVATAGEIVRQDLLPPILDGFLLKGAEDALALFPQPVVRAGEASGRLDDMLDARFFVAVPTGWCPSAEHLAKADAIDAVFVSFAATFASEHVIALPEQYGLIAAWMKRHGAVAALIRPDKIVYALEQCAAALMQQGAGAGLVRSIRPRPALRPT
jgi:3-(3-hydroxy-phenyl)propionate hydroxylase